LGGTQSIQIKQNQFESYEKLLPHLSAWLRADSFSLVAVDGASAAGKTHLATQLLGDLGVRSFELDAHLRTEGPSYPDRVNIGELQSALADARSDGSPILVAGICVLAVLRRAAATPGIHLYIQRLSCNTGMPADADLFDTDCAWFQELSLDLAEEGSKGNRHTQDWIDRQVGTYHKAFSPLQRADIVYRRVEAGAA